MASSGCADDAERHARQSAATVASSGRQCAKRWISVVPVASASVAMTSASAHSRRAMSCGRPHVEARPAPACGNDQDARDLGGLGRLEIDDRRLDLSRQAGAGWAWRVAPRNRRARVPPSGAPQPR